MQDRQPAHQPAPLPVRKRCVLYLSGFDPKGAGHYHGLYRREGAEHSAQQGWQLAVGPRERGDALRSSWSVEATLEDETVHTEYVFLQWDDIVRAHWSKATARLWWEIVQTTLFNLRWGSWWRMFRLSWPPALALLMPFLLVLGLLVLAPLAGLAVALGVSAAQAHPAVALAAGLLAFALLWFLGRALEGRFSMYWLMRSYAFNARQAQGRTPDLQERLDQHAQHLQALVQSGRYDEVLLVGHSSGANMAVSVLGRALAQAPTLGQGGTVLSLLTLGQWIPLMGTLPMAHGFRQELQAIAHAEGVHWLDFSAPPDGCCFALTDPLQACRVERPAAGGVDLKVLNPKFADMLDPLDYQRLKKDRFKLHFQYIMACPKAVDYDYFRITAGPLTLASRYRGLPSVHNFTRLRGLPWERR
jgi:hypothetical protein